MLQAHNLHYSANYTNGQFLSRKDGVISDERDLRYLPMQKDEKIRPNKSSELNTPVISDKHCCARRKSSAANSPA